MSMTKEEAITCLQEKYDYCKSFYDLAAHPEEDYPEMAKYLQALQIALSALRHQIWEEKLWHDAKTDPPKTPGLYYGKKNDTNSMYPCLYRDGIWVLDAYPQTKMDIVKWADYTAFVKEDD